MCNKYETDLHFTTKLYLNFRKSIDVQIVLSYIKLYRGDRVEHFLTIRLKTLFHLH